MEQTDRRITLTNPAEYFQLLSTLPPHYEGDVVLTMQESAFVSSAGSGGDRLLHALSPEESRAYFATMETVAA